MPKVLRGLLATTAMAALAGGLAVAQEQQTGDPVTKTVPVEQPAAQEQPAGEATEEQVTEEQPATEEGAQEEMVEEQPAAEEEADEQVATDAPTPPEGPFIEVQEEGTLLASDLQGLSVLGAGGE
jgi:hypothetical protein